MNLQNILNFLESLLHLSIPVYLLMATGILWILSLYCNSKKDPPGSFKDLAKSDQSADDVEKTYNKYVFRSKLYKWLGILTLFASVVIWAIIQLMNKSGGSSVIVGA